MDSTRKYWHLTTALMVSASLVLSACQESSRKASVRAAGKAIGTNVTESVATKAEVAQKYSKNIKDPRTLSAYQEHLAELFNLLEKSGSVPWSGLFQLKNWIFSGVDLKTVTSFIVEEYEVRHQQAIVRQTQFAVFFDEKAFGALSSVEQGKTILRQYLTGLYSLRGLSDQELCTLVKQSLQGSDCQVPVVSVNAVKVAQAGRNSKAKTQATKAVPNVSRKIERADENQIDRVVALINQKGTQLTEADLLKEMTDAGFDMRLFSLKLGKAAEVANPRKLTDEETVNLFNSVLALNAQEVSCFALRLEENTKCQVSAERSDEFKIPGHAGYRLVSLKVKEAEQEAPILSEVFYELKGQDLVEAMTVKGEKIQLLPLTAKGLEKPEVGMRYRLNYLVVRKAEQNGKVIYALSGVVSIPGVISKVSVVDGKNICESSLAELKEKDKSQDIVLMAADDKLVTPLKELTEKSRPTAPCW